MDTRHKMWGITTSGFLAILLGAGTVGARPGGLPQCLVELTTCTDHLNTCDTGLGTCNTDLATCQSDLAACEAEFKGVLPGDGQGHGPALNYTVNGDGTVTDNNTGLQWELKTGVVGTPNPSDPHDVNNTYTWGDNLNPNFPPNGTLFNVFLAALNTDPCFAGHCDWRIANIRELQSIVDYGHANPAIDTAHFGLTHFGSVLPGNNVYWSTTEDVFAGSFAGAWAVDFLHGDTGIYVKTTSLFARAVRGGP